MEKKKFNLEKFKNDLDLKILKDHLDEQIRIEKARKLKRLKELEDEGKSEFCD